MPGVDYLVLAVDQGRTTGAKLFRWNGTEFGEVPLSAAGWM